MAENMNPGRVTVPETPETKPTFKTHAMRALKLIGTLAVLGGSYGGAALHREANVRAMDEMRADGFSITQFHDMYHLPFGDTYKSAVILGGGACQADIAAAAQTGGWNMPTELTAYRFPDTAIEDERFTSLRQVTRAHPKICEVL